MEKAVAILPADDIQQARRFYVDQLGFTVTYDTSDGGASGLLGLVRGGLEITIDAPMSGHGRQACVALHVDDADAYYEEWRAQVEIPHSPREEEWGARTFSVHDPAGNTMFVIGPATSLSE
jgi:catechol 2,3-dioxygenase-like lactoylglutathione lyase family enzyme